MSNIPLLAGSGGIFQGDFYNTATPPAVIPPPSQYSFASDNSALVFGSPIGLNKVPYTCGAASVSGITVTITCAGINNGTRKVLVDIVSGVDTGPVIPGLPSAGSATVIVS